MRVTTARDNISCFYRSAADAGVQDRSLASLKRLSVYSDGEGDIPRVARPHHAPAPATHAPRSTLPHRSSDTSPYAVSQVFGSGDVSRTHTKRASDCSQIGELISIS